MGGYYHAKSFRIKDLTAVAAPESKTSKRKIVAAERAEKALELRKSGATYERIGNALGVSTSTAQRLAVDALRLVIERGMEGADELRQLEVERLDAMLLSVWRSVRNGHLGAIDRCIKIMERRARLLGLDAPARQEWSGPGGGPIETRETGVDLSKLSTPTLRKVVEELRAFEAPPEK